MAEAVAATLLAVGASSGAAATASSAIGAIGTALPYIAAGTTAAGAIAGGVQADRAAKFEAKQMEVAGDEAEAEAQRKAMVEKRRMDLARSSLRARGAASGTSGGDLDEIDAGIIEQGDYNQMVAFYEGKSRSSKLYGNAASTRASGKNAKRTSYLNAATSVYDIYRKA
jgi:hypothetical protein